jgi:hypothetical protein
VPGFAQPAQTTTTFYDTSLRAWKIVQPDATSVTNEFYPTGLLKKKYGSREYPVAYGYDYAGRMQTMTTWTNFATSSGAAVTTWNYHPYRGWLDNQRYADNTGPDFTRVALSTSEGAQSDFLSVASLPRLWHEFAFVPSTNFSSITPGTIGGSPRSLSKVPHPGGYSTSSTR